jgi:Uma2 family endonuclease
MASAHPPASRGEDWIPVPGTARFPVELTPPPGFEPARLETWPRIDGRLEWVGGRLLYMPPCGDRQMCTVADLVTALGLWRRTHPEFILGTNEAAIRLGDDVRGADAAIWRRDALGEATGGIAQAVPLLVAEASGRYDQEPALRAKAGRYLAAGAAVVWIVLVESREVVVVTPDGETRHPASDRIPGHPDLPDLDVAVADLFRQLGG